MLARQGERASLRLAGDVTAELLGWAERCAREAGASRLLTATWDVGGATARLLEASGYSLTGFAVRMRIEVAGRRFSPRFPDGVAVRTFRDGDAERVYRTHFETFQDVSEPTRATFDRWSHLLLQPPYFHPDLWFLAEDGDELAGIALCDPHPTAVGVGHVGALGVRAPWRGRGLGLALLEHSFAAFAARGSRP
jgi:mycothiol synthase